MDVQATTKPPDQQPLAGRVENDRASARWRRCSRFLCVRTALAAVIICLTPQTVRAGQTVAAGTPKILVLRGVFEVFSLGMNDLNEKIAAHGYDTKVTSWVLALFEASCSDDRPIVVIGHSLGGRMCAWVSRKLNQCDKRVPLIIVVDANLIQPIPANVDKCLNLYVTNDFGIFHGSPVRAESELTEIVNWDVSQGQPSWQDGGVNHFDIDSTDWVHDIIIDEIERHFPLSARYEIRQKATCAKNQTDPNNLADYPAPKATLRDTKTASSKQIPAAKLPLFEPMQPPRRTRAIAWHPTRRPVFEIEKTKTDQSAQTAKKPTSVVWRPTRPAAVR